MSANFPAIELLPPSVRADLFDTYAEFIQLYNGEHTWEWGVPFHEVGDCAHVKSRIQEESSSMEYTQMVVDVIPMEYTQMPKTLIDSIISNLSMFNPTKAEMKRYETMYEMDVRRYAASFWYQTKLRIGQEVQDQVNVYKNKHIMPKNPTLLAHWVINNPQVFTMVSEMEMYKAENYVDKVYTLIPEPIQEEVDEDVDEEPLYTHDHGSMVLEVLCIDEMYHRMEQHFRAKSNELRAGLATPTDLVDERTGPPGDAAGHA